MTSSHVRGDPLAAVLAAAIGPGPRHGFSRACIVGRQVAAAGAIFSRINPRGRPEKTADGRVYIYIYINYFHRARVVVINTV